MAETTHRAELKRLIQTVSNVGNVYDYRRLANVWDDVLSLYKTTISGTDVIRAWQVTCVGALHEGFVTTGQYNTGNKITYQYVCEGFWSIDDANSSEKTALALALAVKDALTSSTLFSSNVTAVTLPSLERFIYRNLGGTICHYAEIKVNVIEHT